MLTRLLLGLMWSRQWDSALPDVLHTYLQLPNRQWKWNLLEYLQSVAKQGSLGKREKEKKLTLCPLREGKKDTDQRLAYFSWNCRKPGLTCGLAFSNEVVAKVELGMEAGIWGMLPVSCFQASREGGGEL